MLRDLFYRDSHFLEIIFGKIEASGKIIIRDMFSGKELSEKPIFGKLSSRKLNSRDLFSGKNQFGKMFFLNKVRYSFFCLQNPIYDFCLNRVDSFYSTPFNLILSRMCGSKLAE